MARALDDPARRVHGRRARLPIRWAVHWYPVWYAQPSSPSRSSRSRWGSGSASAASTTGPTTSRAGRPGRTPLGPRCAQVAGLLPPEHRPQGDRYQYLVTTTTFFVIGAFLAMLFRAELARPGDQDFSPHTFNVLISEHAAIMIFAVVVPVFAGLGNFATPPRSAPPTWRSRGRTPCRSGCSRWAA